MILNGVLSIAFLPVLLLPPAMKLGQGYILTGVCHSVNGGGVSSQGGACSGGVPAPGGCLLPGGSALGGACSGGCLLPGGVCSQGGVCSWGSAWWRPPLGTATAAGGTHPTGDAFLFFHDTAGTSWNDIHVEMIEIKDITTFHLIHFMFFTVKFLAHLPLSVAILVGVTMLALLPVPNCPYEFAPHAYRSPSSDRAMV